MAFGMLSSGVQPIAVEFGVGALKALQVTAGDPPSLIAAACLETPLELRADPNKRFEFQAQALPALLKGAGFKGKRAICSIPASHTLVQHLQVTRTEGVAILTLVMAQIQAQLQCDSSQIVVRAVEAPGAARGGKAEVICHAVAREVVLRQVQALRACKLDAVGAHSEHSAIVRAFDHLTRRESDANLVTLYIDLGAGSTKVAIAHGREIVFAKTVQIGGGTLDEFVAHQLRIGVADARTKRLSLAQLVPAPPPPVAATEEPGGLDDTVIISALTEGAASAAAGGKTVSTRSPASALADADRRMGAPAPGMSHDVAVAPLRRGPRAEVDLSEPLESLTDEIAMCLRYHGSLFQGRRVERAIFVGGEARHIGLCQHVARVLRLPARVADPLAHVARAGKEPCRNVDFSVAQPGWAVPYGLGLCPADL